MVYADGRVWLMKGNTTPEFWEYIPEEMIISRQTPLSRNIDAVQEQQVIPKNIEKKPFAFYENNKVRTSLQGTVDIFNSLGQTVGHSIEINNGYVDLINGSSRVCAPGAYFMKPKSGGEAVKFVIY